MTALRQQCALSPDKDPVLRPDCGGTNSVLGKAVVQLDLTIHDGRVQDAATGPRRSGAPSQGYFREGCDDGLSSIIVSPLISAFQENLIRQKESTEAFSLARRYRTRS